MDLTLVGRPLPVSEILTDVIGFGFTVGFPGSIGPRFVPRIAKLPLQRICRLHG